MAEITMLGTGDALAMSHFNTCFILRQGDTRLLVDGGGGNGILTRLDEAETDCREIDAIFLSHAHTDHILGLVWVLRTIGELPEYKRNRSNIRILSHDEGLSALKTICQATLSKKVWKETSRRTEFIQLRHAEEIRLADGFTLRPLDLRAQGMKQFGFLATLADGLRVACLGDIPCHPEIEPEISGCDWLLHEAFCTEPYRQLLHPERIGHCTALEAAEAARRTNARRLLLYHRADAPLIPPADFAEEARRAFPRPVIVPEDLQTISL